MTGPTEDQTLAHLPEELMTLGYISHGYVENGVDGESDGASASALRLQSIVAELVTAVRSMLLGDRHSAEASVDRVAEMIDRGAVSGISTAAVAYSRSNGITANARGGLAPWQVRRVTAHIESHLDGSITTQDLATLARVSTYHFTRAFRESLSETPHAYVMRRRVERAQGLMLSTNIALGRIAIECGFADQAHFNKLFRRMAGQSPGAWRRARAIPPSVLKCPARAIELGVRK